MAALLDDACGSVHHEPGCLRFEVLEDRDDPNRTHLVEEYVDEAAFQSQMEQPHFFQWRDTVA